jgi:uncharacterized protein (TIGR02391 family)
MTIPRLIPDPDTLLALQPEELAGYVLEYLNAPRQDKRDSISRYNFGLWHTVDEYPKDRWGECQHALMEAWAYLEREGLIAAKPEQEGWYFVTRRGKKVKTHADLEALRLASLFPKDSIHPEIAQTVYPLFLRGEYETAVFQAFKTVEVRVRTAAGFDLTDYGVTLMRKAFHPDTGPLTDTTEPKPEREALQHLFAGAIGRLKNPSSHRHVPITNPAETVEILQFASHLLRIVDDRTAGTP